MKTTNKITRSFWCLLSLSLALLTLLLLFRTPPAQATGIPFGYGFNVSDWDIPLLQSMGFNWMKVFSPPGSRLPLNVLIRIDVHASDMSDLDGLGDWIEQFASEQADYIEAYEIGNEVNLDASYGWAGPPVAADYAELLCAVYGRIKTADPTALVVSAGLAPTGRVEGDWNGHPGHNGFYQDEREYLLEFLAAGGGECLDVVGYHPYGFSADYNAEPDVPSADPTQNCVNGFCFRGVEKIHDLLTTNGHPNTPIWATETGWITTPPDHCLSDPSWQGRLWQIVTPEKQASNLVGAFEYATANMPWLGAIFVFNLNFNVNPIYPECEQMRFYAVQDRPAEDALRDMPKVETQFRQLEVSPGGFTAVITPGQQPYTATFSLSLANSGKQPFAYTTTLTAATLTPTLFVTPTGILSPLQQITLPVQFTSISQTAGIYTAALIISATAGTVNAPTTLPITLYIFDEIYTTYLPAVKRP